MTYQWLVFQVDLDPVMGHEQAGIRPVLVVSAEPLNRRYDVVSVVPLTSRKDNRPTRIGEVLLPVGTGGLTRDHLRSATRSAPLINHVWAVSTAKSLILP